MAKQIDEKQIDLLVERLINRVNKANEIFLKNIGEHIKKLKNISPSKAQQLIQILKYGENYEDIVKKIQKYTNMNVNEIDQIFNSYAKKDQMFYKQFYEYRNIPFIPYEQNVLLQNQTKALANIVKNEMYNFTRNNILGYSINGKFTGLRETYNELLDTAFMNVGQGKETFDTALFNILNQVGTSGLKTLNYESGRSVRLDSAIRMHLKSRLRELHNENQKIYGDEFGADGIEISVHSNPAVDHELVQGRQFSLSEYEKLNSGLEAKDYKGNLYTLDHDGKNGYRPISEMNCYHYIFSIVLGVSEPEYSDEELKQIIKDNDKGFEYEGRHYSNYEGTQLQRKLELEIRKQKDTQILARESDNKELISEAQSKITVLTNKYNELSQVSGLPKKMDRMRISGYSRMKIPSVKQFDNKKDDILMVSNSVISNKEELLSKWDNIFKDDNIVVKRILNAEPNLIDKQATKVNELLNKYKFVKEEINNDYDTNALTLQVNTPDMIGEGNYARLFGGHYMEFNEKYFKDETLLYNEVKSKIEKNWWQNINKENYNVYPVTHEYGHLLEYKIIDIIEHKHGYKGSVSKASYIMGDEKLFNEIAKQVPNIQKYLSDYGKSTKRFEWFAETFTQMELGEETELTKAFKKYLNEFMEGNYEYFR